MAEPTIPPHLRFAVQPMQPPLAGHLRLGPPGTPALTADSRCLLRDGEPWFPVMGEIHYSRVPRAQWEDSLRAMRAAGIEVVATYVFWIHHEEEAGRWRWDGQRDLRAFIRLCGDLGFTVWLRPGPWAHGECRNGGFPDWLEGSCRARTNDPTYLALVGTYLRQIAAQVHGLLHADGGPIIGLQIENEYGHCGIDGSEEHIRELKRMMRSVGLETPYYAVTGWGGAWVPEDEVLPMQGGYADGFWERGCHRLAPPSTMLIRRSKPAETAIGTDRASPGSNRGMRYDPGRYPLATAEVGGGMPPAWHRRPLLQPEDTLAVAAARIAEGASVLGYYMFAGGTNPVAVHGFLQEDDFNQVPVKSYDFRAPVGEFGKIQNAYHHLRLLNFFLRRWGGMLAGMAAHPAEDAVSATGDVRLRTGLRCDGRQGFLVVSNHQRYVGMPRQEQVRFRIALPDRVLTFPTTPLTVEPGTVAILPINLPVAGTTIAWATGQPIALLDGRRLVLAALPGAGSATISCAGREIDIPAGGSRNIDDIDVFVLAHEQALGAWLATIDGMERLILGDGAEIWQDGPGIRLRFSGPGPAPALHCIPPLPSDRPLLPDPGSLPAIPAPSLSAVEQPPPACDATYPYPAQGPVRAWRLLAPHPDRWGPASDLLVDLAYTGDIARLYLEDELVADHFWAGDRWRLALGRWKDRLALGQRLILVIAPWRRGQAVFTEHPPELDGDLTARIDHIEAAFEQRLVVARTNAAYNRPETEATAARV